MMEKAGLAPYLDLIISNEDVKKAKPDPEIYQKAMKELHITPQECIICEDNINGIRAALDSGGNLLRINEVSDVNYENVSACIRELEKKYD